MVQAQAIKLLFDKMRQLRYDFRKDPMLRTRFRRPIFRIAVLYVEEEESVRRQLQRGEKAHLHNKTVADTGVGEPVVRAWGCGRVCVVALFIGTSFGGPGAGDS